MNEINNIFIIDPDSTAGWLDKFDCQVNHVSIDDLYTKEEKFSDAIVFIDNNPVYCRKIKEVLPINPGINFILYYYYDCNIHFFAKVSYYFYYAFMDTNICLNYISRNISKICSTILDSSVCCNSFYFLFKEKCNY